VTIGLNSISTAKGANVSTISVNHTAGSSNSLVTILVGWRGSTSLSPTVTYAGSSASLLVQKSQSIANIALFSFRHPPEGPQAVEVTLGSTVEDVGLVVASYLGTTQVGDLTSAWTQSVSTKIGTTVSGGVLGGWVIAGATVLQAHPLPTSGNSSMVPRAGLDMVNSDVVFGDQPSSAGQITWNVSSAQHSFVSVGVALLPGAGPAEGFFFVTMG